jgi:excisionase family DNA binding protein
VRHLDPNQLISASRPFRLQPGAMTCSVPEAGELLGIGRDAAYAAAGRNEIPTLRLGRTLRVPVPKLLELLGATPDMSEPGLAGPGIATTPIRQEEDDVPDRTLRSAV